MPKMTDRRVLHVLPHPGGGGGTYTTALEEMQGYEFARLYLASTPAPSLSLAAGVACALREARRYELVHVHGEVAAGLCLPALATRPAVVTLHGLNFLRRSRGLGRRAAIANLRAIARSSGRTICVSEAERREVEAVLGAKRAARLAVVRNGVRPRPVPTQAERDSVRARLGVAPHEVVALWIGSLEAPKQPDVPLRATIEAARSGLPVRLVLAGDGSMRSRVDALARGRPEVQVLGFRDDARELLAGADLFVLSSRREGLPFAVLEAMALGVPTLATLNPGIVEAVGDTGIVVAPDDTAGFADALRRLATSPEERSALGRAARERVRRCFSAEEMVSRTRDVYEHVLRERRS